VPASGPPGKVRSPIVVILLTLVTLGIYGLYWWYASFQELKDHTHEGVGGVVGLILGLCISIVNVFLLPVEVGNAYARAGREKDVTGLTGFWILLPLVGYFVWVFRVQGAMNRYWESLAR
jgi:hypothetical protein